MTTGPAGRPVLEESAEELYEGAPCGYLSTDPDGRIERVNRTFLEWTGYRREELVGKRRFAQLLSPGGQIYHDTHYAPLLRMQGSVREIAVEIVRADGSRLPVLVNSVQVSDVENRPVLVRTTVFDATDRKAYERELLAARQREQEARERVERLQEVTAALTAALEPRDIASAVVDAVAHSTGAAQAVLALVDEEHGLRVLARHGSRSFPLPARELLDQGDRPVSGSGRLDVPLAATGEPLGVLSLDLSAGEPLGEEEHAFVLACARQAAQALERARLHEQTRDVALALQQSMLAGTVPADPRFTVATRYLPAVESLEVGGDWYDAFLVTDERIGLVVGDVVGRGLDAASAMGQLRSAVRALALTGVGPAAVIEGLDRFAERLASAAFATLAYCEIDLATDRVAYAAAGHPPPVLVPPDGPPELLWGGRSAPLAVHRGARAQAAAPAPAGSRLLLYSDGLVERRNEVIDDRIAELVRELAERRAEEPAALVDHVVSALLADTAGHDDVCLLCAALTPGR